MSATARSGARTAMWMVTAATLLAAGGAGYWRYATAVPALALQAPPMPEPNGFVRFEDAVMQMVEATSLSPQDAGGPSGAYGPPITPYGPPTLSRAAPFRPRAETPREQRERLLRARPALAAVRAALKLRWRAPRPTEPSDPASLFPVFAPSRECARYFVAESRLAESQGNRGMAIANSLDAVELGSKLPWGTAMIGRLVAVAIDAIGFARAAELAPSLPPHTIPSALARVRRIRHEWPPMSETWESERVTHLTMMNASFRAMRQQSPYEQIKTLSSIQVEPSPWETLRLAITPRRLAVTNADRFLRQLAVESKKPFRQRRRPTPPGDAWTQNLGGLVYAPETELRLERPRTQLAVLEVYLAARLHRLHHGRYPARLAEIDRRWLPAVPKDQWDQPIAYRLRSGKPAFYSLGPNGKDDGGQAADPITLRLDSRGDLVFGALIKRLEQPQAR